MSIISFSWQGDRENGSRILGGCKSEVHARRDCRAWSGGLETRGDSKCEEHTNDRVSGSSWRTRNSSRVQESHEEKLLCMCQERADIMYSVKETARKMYCERRDEREAHRAIHERCSDCKESVLSRSTHSHSSLTCTQTATGQDSTKRARAQAVE